MGSILWQMLSQWFVFEQIQQHIMASQTHAVHNAQSKERAHLPRARHEAAVADGA